jgi:hypothetical protein
MVNIIDKMVDNNRIKLQVIKGFNRLSDETFDKTIKFLNLMIHIFLFNADCVAFLSDCYDRITLVIHGTDDHGEFRVEAEILSEEVNVYLYKRAFVERQNEFTQKVNKIYYDKRLSIEFLNFIPEAYSEKNNK